MPHRDIDSNEAIAEAPQLLACIIAVAMMALHRCYSIYTSWRATPT